MKSGTILKWSFIASLVITFIGTYLKFTHTDGAYAVLICAIISSLIFIVAAIDEVRSAATISKSEKRMWTIAFISMGGLTGLIYFLFGRKRIVQPD